MKLRRQYTLTRDAIKLMIYLSTTFFDEINDLIRASFKFTPVAEKFKNRKPEVLNFIEILAKEHKDTTKMSIAFKTVQSQLSDVVNMLTE